MTFLKYFDILAIHRHFKCPFRTVIKNNATEKRSLGRFRLRLEDYFVKDEGDMEPKVQRREVEEERNICLES